MDRRRFLMLCAGAIGLAGGAAGLAGCTSEPTPGPTDPPTDSPTPEQVDPDADVRAAAAKSEVALLAAYARALADHPEMDEQLRPLMAHHEAHLDRLAPGATPAQVETRPSSPAAGSPSAAPPSPGSTLSRLANAEGKAARSRGKGSQRATATDLARDLCLIAASEAQHRAILTRLAAREVGP